jgi:quinol monooxygenase YgiN
MGEFVTFKRWRLKDGRQESELATLVQDEIIPAYRKLPGCLRLGLLRVEGSRSYLATQHWESRTARDATLNDASYRTWWDAYKPTLERWDQTMAFEEEWEAEVLL